MQHPSIHSSRLTELAPNDHHHQHHHKHQHQHQHQPDIQEIEEEAASRRDGHKHRHRHRCRTATLQTRLAPMSANLVSIYQLAILLLLLLSQSSAPNHLVVAFNVDTQSAVLHHGPPGSYFGFSVAQHRDRGVHYLLVGAPRAQTDQPKTEHSGAVYRCQMGPKSCQQVPFDTNGSSAIKLGNELVQTDSKSHQWFGASLQSANDNGSFIACAPSFVYYSISLKRRDPVGTCWVSRGSFNGFLEYSPCKISDQWGHHKLGSCQAGFSSAISKDGGRIFMGAPGAHVWQGQVFAHDLRTELSQSTSAVNPHSEDDSYLGFSLALGRFSALSKQAQPASSWHQTSSSGNRQQHNQHQKDQSDVVIGIPRGAELAGRVMLVDRDLKFLFNLTGEQFGSRFGETLAVADVNGDSLDDLIVSAPLYFDHKERQLDRGRVYVYLQTQRPANELALAQRIDGQQNGARFGHSLANCGDLNRDGYQDIAVGAPYGGLEQRGAVYIFMGSKNGLSPEPDQVIYAESIRGEARELRTFGYSLSGGLDMDNNQYPDLLIGDYAADRAVLLRSRPIVNVTSSLTFSPENFDLEQRNCTLPVPDPAVPGSQTTSVSCITVRYCLKYNGLGVDSKLPFVFDVKLDSENKDPARLFFLEREDRAGSTLFSKDVQQCKQFRAYITKSIRDKLTPMRIDIEYNLADLGDSTSIDYTTSLAKLRPVLNKSQPNKLSKSASIQKHCGYDNVCVPDLKLSMEPNMQQYTIGSKESLVLDVQVKNNGEDAFESKLYLTMPMTINFINVVNKSRSEFPLCVPAKPDQTGTNVLQCDLGNPLVRNDSLKFSIITEPTRYGSFSEPDFTFVGLLNSTNPEADERRREDNQVALGIPIRVEVSLVPSGSSHPSRVVFNWTPPADEQQTSDQYQLGRKQAKLLETDIGQEIYHTYNLQNRGPSTINNIALTIYWPSKNDRDKYLLYLVDEPLTDEKIRCKPAPEGSINPDNVKYMRGNTILQQAEQQQQPAAIRREGSQTSLPSSTVDSSLLEQYPCSRYTKCTRFDCNVVDLGHNQIATVRIRSRLYEETLMELALKDFDISSRMIAQVKALPNNVSTRYQAPVIYEVVTQVQKPGQDVQDLFTSWLIIPGILLGILLLLLLVYCLKLCGFFDRKRPQKTPPGATEREPLTPSMWNDYQYTPGDTAL